MAGLRVVGRFLAITGCLALAAGGLAAPMAAPAMAQSQDKIQEKIQEKVQEQVPAKPDGGSAPAAAAQPQPPTPPSQPATSAAGGLPTLVPGPTDSGNIDVVDLPARPVVIMNGKSSWDEGFKTIFETFKTIDAALARAGIKPAGRPITVFLTTDDATFNFQAMVPIAAIPDGKAQLTPDISFGTTPSGSAIRFTHKAPYEEIDNTYEAITAYLDAKGIAVKDSFIEEYGNDPKDPSDPDLQINIFVQPK